MMYFRRRLEGFHMIVRVRYWVGGTDSLQSAFRNVMITWLLFMVKYYIIRLLLISPREISMKVEVSGVDANFNA